MGLPTVREVWRLALPTDTRLVNANGDLVRTVSWARRLRLQPPAFVALEHGEMALIASDTAHPLSERLTHAKIVETVAEREAAAIVFAGEFSPEAQVIADSKGLCVFSLPPGTDLANVEKDVIRSIVEREAQLDRRGRFFGCANRNEGEQMCYVLAEIGEETVLVAVPVYVGDAYVAPQSAETEESDAIETEGAHTDNDNTSAQPEPTQEHPCEPWPQCSIGGGGSDGDDTN